MTTITFVSKVWRDGEPSPILHDEVRVNPDATEHGRLSVMRLSLYALALRALVYAEGRSPGTPATFTFGFTDSESGVSPSEIPSMGSVAIEDPGRRTDGETFDLYHLCREIGTEAGDRANRLVMD